MTGKQALYQQLDANNIRLLEVESSKELRYKFHEASLGQLPKYIAVSYTWGAPIFDHKIVLENEEVSVTKNLSDLLRTWSRHFQANKLLFWVDALCIDQDDIEERNAQVRNMGLVYSQAAEVFVWLGVSSQETKTAFRKIHQLAEFYLKLPQRPSGRSLTQAGIEAVTADNPVLYGPVGSDCYNAWQAIFALCKREWWTRVWIVQEATGPSHPLLFTGLDNCYYDYLEMAMLICHYLDLEGKVDSSFLDDNNRSFRRLTHIREGRRNRTAHITGLASLMNRSGTMACTDPRDKIYAMLGMASDVSSVKIAIDYSRSVREVYIEYVRWAMATATRGHELDFLGDAGSGLDRVTFVERVIDDTNNGLPSWTPDWISYDTLMRPKAWHTVFLGGDHKGQSIYQPGGQRLPRIEINEDREMKVEGFRIGNISKTSDFSVSLQDPATELQILEEMSGPGLYHTGESIYDVCRHTLKGDLINTPTWAFSRSGSVDPGKLRLNYDDPSVERRKARMSEIRGMKQTSCVRRLIHTRNCYIGLAHGASAVDDEICVLYGGSLCYVLRPLPGGREHRFIGECYLHGFMDGEGLDLLKQGKTEEQVFVII